MCNYFQAGALYAKLYTWEKSSTFKDKCEVNAVNCKCNLLTGPLINMILNGSRQSLKREISNNVQQHRG